MDSDGRSAGRAARVGAGPELAIAYVLLYAVGIAGGHRYYLRRTGSAALMTLAFLVSAPLVYLGVGQYGLFALGAWCLVDALLLPGMVRRARGATAPPGAAR